MTTAALTFAALQSASLCLACTPPERMAAALSTILSPLRLVGFPTDELVLTLLLALRFIAMVSPGIEVHCALCEKGGNPGSSMLHYPDASAPASGCTGRILNTSSASQVFEEARHLLLGLATRTVDYSALGVRGTANIALTGVVRLFGNLHARANNVALSMTARGFAGPGSHHLRLDRGAALPRTPQNAILLLSLCAIGALCSFLP